MAAPPVLSKDATESKLFNIDLTQSLASGETISTVTLSAVTGDGALTIGTPVVSGDVVQTRISGGTGGQVYQIEVTATTNLGNTIDNFVGLFINAQNWTQEAIITLRVMIGDLFDPQQYSDLRLLQLLTVCAKLVVQELFYTTYPTTPTLESLSPGGGMYYINVSTLTILPDPLSIGDYSFINFIVLRAACMVDQNAIRTKAAIAGLRANIGPASLNTDDYLKGFLSILENGPCSTYETLKTQFAYGSPFILSAVLSPFSNNKFSPEILGVYMANDRHGYYNNDAGGGYL